MKKNLLFITALILGGGMMAQNAKKHLTPVPVKNIAPPAQVDPEAMDNTKQVGFPTPHKQSAICNPQAFTSSPNAFAVGGGATTFMQNCLSYNKDLNAVLWTSRVSADWAFSGKTSGCIQTSFLDLSTNLWDSMIIYRDSSNDRPARYPGGVAFSPTGATTVSAGYMVGSGPVTSKTGTPAWKGEWYAKRQPTGNYHSTAIPNDVSFDSCGLAPFGRVGNTGTNVGFLNTDMQQAGQNVFVAGPMYDFATTTEMSGAIIAKGAYSAGNFTWTADSIKPPFMVNAQGKMNNFQSARIAFDLTGQIGYAVFIGRDSTTFGNSADSTMMPMLYKTTDAGLTWNYVLAGYDWSCLHKELMQNIDCANLIYGSGTSSARHMTPFLNHGVDLTVDKNGVLHYVTTLTMPYKDGNYAGVADFDSLQYTYNYKWDHIYHHPVIWDLMTDGTAGWTTLLVDSVMTSAMGNASATDTTTLQNPWQNGAAWLPYGAHLTVSRSSDGKIIFYGWGDTDTSVTGNHWNTQPEMMMKAYDVTTGKMSALQNVTGGVGACFFSFLSDNSYFDAILSKWVAPFVYAVGRVQVSPGVYNGISPVQYYYGNCATFDASNINLAAVINQESIGTGKCANGIETHSNYMSSISNYPNPFNGTTNIVVHLTQPKPIDLKVYDAIGNLVFTKKVSGNFGENTIVFDGSPYNAGIYYYTLTSGYEKVTKKMVIQK